MHRQHSAQRPRTYANVIAAAGGIAAMTGNAILDVLIKLGMYDRAKRENRQRTRVEKRRSKSASWPVCGKRHMARIARQVAAGSLRVENGLVPCLLLALTLFACQPAFAHEHPPEHAALHNDFYKTWDRPDLPGYSCCSEQDCAPVAGVRRTSSGGYEALRASDNTWLAIPPEKIEERRDSPDGQSHMCSIGTVVFCFLFGAGI